LRSVPAAVAALAIAGLLIAGALSLRTRPSATTRPEPGVALIGGVPLQQARCEQWMAGSRTERDAVVGALAGTVGGPSSTGGVGTTLTASEANALFDHACASSVASGFLLYELYIRAAGFRSLREGLGSGVSGVGNGPRPET
jgi:hypothetical protein